MRTEVVNGWNVFKQIFTEHWERLKKKYPKYSEGHYEEQGKKMLSCGNPEETCPHENGDGIYKGVCTYYHNTPPPPLSRGEL